jgi:hypothetical protein
MKYLWLLGALICFTTMLKTDVFDKQVFYLIGGVSCVISFLFKNERN